MQARHIFRFVGDGQASQQRGQVGFGQAIHGIDCIAFPKRALANQQHSRVTPQAIEQLKQLQVARVRLISGGWTQHIHFIKTEQRLLAQRRQITTHQPQCQVAILQPTPIGDQLVPERRGPLFMQKAAQGKEQTFQLIIKGQTKGKPKGRRRRPLFEDGRAE